MFTLMSLGPRSASLPRAFSAAACSIHAVYERVPIRTICNMLALAAYFDYYELAVVQAVDSAIMHAHRRRDTNKCIALLVA
jgi:hypothetical protein